MQLPRLDELQSELKRYGQEQSSYEREKSPRADSPSLTEKDVLEIEETLKINLPEIFKELILTYDFNTLKLGAVSFGDGSYKSFLLRHNQQQIKFPNSPWWGWDNGERPKYHILIAGTDSYAILLDTRTAIILAFLDSEPWKTAKEIASDFELFVQASAFVYLNRNKSDDKLEFSTTIANLTNASRESEFWEDLAQGFA